MKKSVNIIFSSAGRRVALVNEFRRASAELGLSGVLIGADLASHAPALFVCDQRCALPAFDSDEYVPALLELVRHYEARLLVPLHDGELLKLSAARDRFAALGCHIPICGPEGTRICMDKRRSYEFFLAGGFAPAWTLTADEAMSRHAELRYPVLVKPWDGFGGRDIHRVDDERSLRFYLARTPNPIVQELLEGVEFTMDVWVDSSGQVRCVVPRRRVEVRSGEVSKAQVVKDPQLMQTTRRLCRMLPAAEGMITVQCFRQLDGQLRYSEINPRFGGGVPLAIRAGADFPKWILQQLLGVAVEADENYRDGLVMLRYDQAVFVDSQQLGPDWPGGK